MTQRPNVLSTRVSEDQEGQTLSAVVRELLECPWSQAKKLVTSGRVQLNDQVCEEIAERVRTGDQISVSPNAPKKSSLALDESRIIHLDHDLIVVNKPANLISVPFESRDKTQVRKASRPEDSLVLRCEERLRILSKSGTRSGNRSDSPANKSSGQKTPLGVVQRLDKDTTGLLVFARNRKAKRHLENQFRAHSVNRRYLALVFGAVQSKTITSHLVPDRGDGIRGSWSRKGVGGKPPQNAKHAITHVKVQEHLHNATLVACQLETGRQNQIRIHLGEAGHPLLGERIYGGAAQRSQIPAARPMLHAATLGFRHPSNEQWMVFEQALPDDMAGLLEQLREK